MVSRHESCEKWLKEQGLLYDYLWAMMKMRLWVYFSWFTSFIYTKEKRCSISSSLFIETIDPIVNYLKHNSDYWDKGDLEKSIANLNILKSIKRIRAVPDFKLLDGELKMKVLYAENNAIKLAGDAVVQMMSRRATN